MAELLEFLWTLIGIICATLLLGGFLFACVLLGLAAGGVALDFIRFYRTHEIEEDH